MSRLFKVDVDGWVKRAGEETQCSLSGESTQTEVAATLAYEQLYEYIVERAEHGSAPFCRLRYAITLRTVSTPLSRPFSSKTGEVRLCRPCALSRRGLSERKGKANTIRPAAFKRRARLAQPLGIVMQAGEGPVAGVGD